MATMLYRDIRDAQLEVWEARTRNRRGYRETHSAIVRELSETRKRPALPRRINRPGMVV